MRMLVSLIVVSVAAGSAAVSAHADAAQPFHSGVCQPISETRTVCAEIWGVSKQSESGSFSTLAQRRFAEYTNGQLTFEQRDLSHHVIVGQGDVTISLFKGVSTPSGLTCRWRDHVVVVNGGVVYSIDEFGCS